MATLPEIWPQVVEGLRGVAPGEVALDVSPMTCVDSSWLALFAEIRRLAARAHAELTISGLTPALKTLLDMAVPSRPDAAQLDAPRPPGFITEVGEKTAGGLARLQSIVSFAGELFSGFFWAMTHPRLVRWRELSMSCEKAGADAAPVVLVLGFLIGVMLAFQAAEQTERYGVRTIIPNVVAVAVARELGPLIASLLLAGRSGSALAAELGTMKK
jgi:phospholipid/cholesterol/gamma-HCH transport system permease protein